MKKPLVIFAVILLFYFLVKRKGLNVNAKFTGVTRVNKENLSDAYRAILKSGFNNPLTISALLGMIERESRFELVPEVSYAGTSNYRIRNIFKTKLGDKSDAFIDDLKKDKEKFFNYVYGGILGNVNEGDGYRYRGRGLNQLTGRGNYQEIERMTGLPIEKNPDLVNENIENATRCFVAYLQKAYENAKKSGKWANYFSNTLNNPANLEEANRMITKLNGGWDKSYTSEGHKYAVEASKYYYDLITD